jgi:hypothetical protein
MNPDEDKIYTKIVAFDEIYNFVVRTFFHLKSSLDSKINILSRSQFTVSKNKKRRALLTSLVSIYLRLTFS